MADNPRPPAPFGNGLDLRDNLSKWLLDNGYAEPKRGYGHVSAVDLADALIDAGWIAEEHET